MSQTSFTPGPWVVNCVKAFGAYGVWTDYPTHPGHDGTGYGDQICDMLTVSFKQADQKTRPQRDANAKLIAASPDLLAACELLLESFGHPEGLEFWNKAKAAAAAALAKAKGGAP